MSNSQIIASDSAGLPGTCRNRTYGIVAFLGTRKQPIRRIRRLLLLFRY